MFHSHNKALDSSAATMRLSRHEGSIACGISAYCAALRIRVYLWRINARRTVRTEEYLTRLKDEGFLLHCRRISRLIVHEFVRNEDAIRQAGRERRLVSPAVTVGEITISSVGEVPQGCSICQDTHYPDECASLVGCSCTFGRLCLRGLLNQNSPWSNRCPNCRAVLHEPLVWGPQPWKKSQVGLLWTLNRNVECLRKEIEELYECRQDVSVPA